MVGGLGALAFLALGKVGFVFGFCVPCHVLKIALGRVGKVMDDCICAGCFNRVTHKRNASCYYTQVLRFLSY